MLDRSEKALQTNDAAPQKSRRQGRWIAVCVGAFAGVYAAAFSFAVLNDDSNPRISLALHPGLPQAAAKAGDLHLFNAAQRAIEREGKTPPGVLPPSLISGIGLDLSRRDRAAVEAHALAALRSTPLSSDSLRQLAFFEDDLDRRRKLLDLAEQVTKRDVLAIIQQTELKLRENDIDGGLAGFDRSLVVSRTVDSAVFPLLLGAAGVSEDMALAVRKRLSHGPPWAERMMRWAIANPAYLPVLSTVIEALPLSSPARSPGYGQQVVDLLTTQRRYPEAFAAYRAFEKSGRHLGDMTHSAYPPIDWKLVDSFDTGSRPFNQEGVEIFANPGRQGEFAQVLTDFPPGPKQLTLRVDETMGGGSTLRFAAVCLSGETERKISERELTLRDGVAAFPFAVPLADCPFQRLTLGIAGGPEAASALVRSVSFGRGTAQ